MSDLSPDDIALLEAHVPVGLLMPTDETMRLVHITRDVVEAHVGAAAESVTTTDGLVFWFDVGSGNLAVNRMATLNLLAVSSFSARTVPLLRGTARVPFPAPKNRGTSFETRHIYQPLARTSSVLAEDAVDLPACVVEHVDDALLLLSAGGVG